MPCDECSAIASQTASTSLAGAPRQQLGCDVRTLHLTPLAKTLTEQGVPHELMLMEGGHHGFSELCLPPALPSGRTTSSSTTCCRTTENRLGSRSAVETVIEGSTLRGIAVILQGKAARLLA